MAEPRIVCSKCGKPSAEPRPDCALCGGRNVRVCANCGAQNSVSKRFCDRCGRPSGYDPSPAARATEPAAGPPATLLAAAALRPPPRSRAPKVKPPSSRRRAALALGALALAVLAAAGLRRRLADERPETLVPRLAARYLDALRAGDDAAAYAFFSSAARARCTLEEFRASRDRTPWTWSNLSVAHQEPGAVLLAYDLDVQGRPPRRDYVLFTLENGRWTRPYNWTLLREVEAAFDHGDPEAGRQAAEQAAEINPRDPMAWGYLCEAAYYRKAPEDAERWCRRALSLARDYPSDLTPKSLYHLRAVLADTEKNALNRPDKALEQFAAMLAFPGVSAADQCQILLSRAQAYLALGRRAEAGADLDRAEGLCSAPRDRADLSRMRAAVR